MNIQIKEYTMIINLQIMNLILIKEVIMIPLNMKTIMYINIYLILTRKISKQII